MHSPISLACCAVQIAKDDIAHVNFLRSALGDAAVPQPQINIGNSFAQAANDVINVSLPVEFTPYGNDALFLLGAFLFGDVGVTAYTVWRRNVSYQSNEPPCRRDSEG